MAQLKNRPRSFSTGHKTRSQNFLYRFFISQRFFTAIGLFCLILITLPLARTYSQKKIIEKELAELQANIDKFEYSTTELQEMVKYLDSEQSLESQARLNLNLKKPGETVVVIESELGNIDQDKEILDQNEEISNFKKWQNYFLKNN